MPYYNYPSSHSGYNSMRQYNSNDNSDNYYHQQNPNFEEQFGGNSMYNANSSRLVPTAQEFYPASYNSTENNSRRPQGSKWSGKNQRYGSGRTASSNTYENSSEYQQFSHADQVESFASEPHISSANSNATRHTITSEEPNSSQTAQNSRKFTTENSSKAYSKNRYENRTNFGQENKYSSSRKNDFYRGGNSKNFELESSRQCEENSGESQNKKKNCGLETNFKGKSNGDSSPKNSANELREEAYNETSASQEHSGKNKHYNHKNKNTNKSRNNFYSGGNSSNLDHKEAIQNNFDYDNFPSSMRYQGNSSKNIRSKSNYYGGSFHDNLYKNRDDTSYKSRDDTSYRSRDGPSYKNRDDSSYKSRNDSSYKSRDDTSYKTRDDTSYKSRDDAFYRSKDNSRESSRENGDDWNGYENNYSGSSSSNYRGARGKAFGNWRNKPNKYVSEKKDKKFNAAGQRERLIDMIDCRTLECLVCCEKIKTNDKVWSCMQCYHIMHLNCISAWAKSSKVEENWRCPACQNICSELPNQYICYCGKTSDPKFDPNVIAHGCGEMCLRKGRNCDHKCTILCHPGPCPDCNIMVSKSCGCGKTSQTVKCSTELEIVCDAICHKALECGIHECTEKCHVGPCSSCREIIVQECYCGKTGRKVPCTSEYSGQTDFGCENPCQKILSCGNHKCEKQCHSGDCGPCIRDISVIVSCYCGKIPLKEARTSCLDPIPCCDKICGKILSCGQPSKPHSCQEKCHESKCPPCPLTTVVRCRCGHMDKEMACQKLTTKADDARCEKKCSKKRLCGKHKCNQRCCIEIEHFCPLPCNHFLSCGLHRCDRTCHSGRCPPCLESSFEELHCECGASVIYPPVPCGTKPPSCTQPCSRTRPCGHPPNHDCHAGPCPPCFVLTKRWCYGHHEQRAAIPCHQENFSCGLPCGKAMPCGRHKCTKPCHEGSCPLPCAQPCTVPRLLCGHPCGKPCHDAPCPETFCKQMVAITCLCGLQKGSRPCTEVADEFRNIEMAKLKEKIENMSVPDQAVDISDIVTKPKRPAVLKILDCNDDCKTLERNRRLAIGLQIRNPDLSQKLTPRYSDFMKQWAKKDPHFCQKVHDRLTELVQLAKQSKQKSRSYSFESMNRDKRHFIHEYVEHFGCDSAAYDQEPNRNVVATAVKDKSWLPSFSLLEVIQRENGQRKVPGPILASSSSTKSETVFLKVTSRAQKPAAEKAEETLVKNPWTIKPPADSEENDRYFSNP